jgi:hypothetical protein
MKIGNKLTIGTITLTNFAANGAIGTAAATVDIASSFTINQTTAGITLTIPSPTINDIGQVLTIMNVGSVSVVINSVTVAAGRSVDVKWNGNSWANAADLDSNSTAKTFYQSTALGAGTNIITHNLALTTPFKSLALSVIDDATGEQVQVTITNFATNAITIQSAIAIATANIFIVAN